MGQLSLQDCSSKSCGDIFDQLVVVPRITGGTLVAWTVRKGPLITPVRYHLQYSNAGAATDDDWTTIGEAGTDATTLIDPARRSHGFYRYSNYRVVAIDAVNRVYVSRPQQATPGELPRSQRRDYQEILRRESKRYGLKDEATSKGYLLKIRHHGPRCNQCRDEDSGEPLNPNCSNCYGVGYVAGYYPAQPCFNVDLSPASHDLKTNQLPGIQHEESLHEIRFLNIPHVHPKDIWVDALTDYRYELRNISPIVSFGSHYLVCKAGGVRLAFANPVYRIDVQPAPGLPD